jgi:asparagine synthetase B (glutamine-hydrolysing)
MSTDRKGKGAFSIFGFVQEHQDLLRRRLSERLSITPRIIDFGNAGRLFFFTSYGDVAESEDAIVFKAGFLRSLEKSPLSSRQLLDRKHIAPQGIDVDAFRGNALITCFNKTQAEFLAFKNLLSQPQLYYRVSGGEFIASDRLRCLIDVLDQVELNEDVVPFHFVFQHAPGPLTYFKDVHRLLPGQVLRWKEGRLSISQVQYLRFSDVGPVFDRVDSQTVAALYQELSSVIEAYVREIERSGHELGNLLSGGVDSSICQLIINEQLSSTPARSFSFALAQEPCYEREITYARQATKIFETEHTFVEFTARDYPDLVVKTIETLGQPMITHIEPCKLLIASFLAKHEANYRFFFTALAADVLFGLGITRKIKAIELLRRIPGARLSLALCGKLLEPFTERCRVLLKGAELLSSFDDPHPFIAPASTIGTCSDLDIACRAFGTETVTDVLEYRRSLQKEYLASADCAERVHATLLLSYFYEIQAQSGQLFLACDKEQVYPFLDDDIIRISLAFRPRVRYIQGLRTKPALKDILEHHGLSSIARKRKGGTGFDKALSAWMRSGPLREMVADVERPGFLSKADFAEMTQAPGESLWSLLVFGVFKKRVLGSQDRRATSRRVSVLLARPPEPKVSAMERRADEF